MKTKKNRKFFPIGYSTIALFAVIVGVRGDAGYLTPGPLGLIVGLGMIGAIRAVWKKDKTEDDDNRPSKQ